MEDVTSFLPRKAALRFTLWLLALLIWTAALLRPEPSALEAATLPTEAIPFASKILHVVAYAGLVLLSCWQSTFRPVQGGLVLVVIIHALATEYLQQFVPPRTASWTDVGFNAVGILVGLVGWEVGSGYSKRLRRSLNKPILSTATD